MLASATSIHEVLHMNMGSLLEVKILNLRALSLGNIYYILEAMCPEKALIAAEPYRRPHQYLFLTLWIISYSIPIFKAPLIAKPAFILMATLPLTLLLASMCTLKTIHSLNNKSLCYKIAVSLGSKSNLMDIEECLNNP